MTQLDAEWELMNLEIGQKVSHTVGTFSIVIERIANPWDRNKPCFAEYRNGVRMHVGNRCDTLGLTEAASSWKTYGK